MSELEKIQRDKYQKFRNQHILKRSILTALLVIGAFLCGVFAKDLSDNSFITYQENGVVDYQGYLDDNRFYTEEYLDEDHAYIAELITKINADFGYHMVVNAKEVKYSYAYYVDATLQITDRTSGAPLYDPVYEIIVPQTQESNKTSLSVQENVSIDYRYYNEKAEEFVEFYDLDNVDCNLLVTMHMDVVSACPEYANTEQGKYDVSMRVPLCKDTFKIETSTSVAEMETKILACNDGLATLLTALTIIFAVLASGSAVLLGLFIIQTRDQHIDYARKVKKILNAYRSYIQCINNAFDTANYQTLEVKTIEELLDLRDTLQMPILLYENEDKTCATFMIPTSDLLLYQFEIRVSDSEAGDK